MKEHKVGIIMNGVTGRMGTNQHLIRSIVAIRKQGGVQIKPGEVIMPDPILVGRSEEKLRTLGAAHGITRVSTDLDATLKDPANQIYFDSTLTGQRPLGVRKAIAAKKHIYCEKPTATTSKEALYCPKLALPQTHLHPPAHETSPPAQEKKVPRRKMAPATSIGENLLSATPPKKAAAQKPTPSPSSIPPAPAGAAAPTPVPA